MKILLKSIAFTMVGGLLVTTESSQAASTVSASATISDVAASGGVFDYTITLQNTGTTTIDSFWYAWTLSGNNLNPGITDPGSSLGWTDTAILGNTSISWEDTTSSHPLGVGQSATFTFDSTETPTAITTSPAGESVVYVSGTGPNTFGQNNPGVASAVFSPTLVVPEPSTLALLAGGLPVLMGSLRWLKNTRKNG